jgi:hypothetical protein
VGHSFRRLEDEEVRQRGLGAAEEAVLRGHTVQPAELVDDARELTIHGLSDIRAWMHNVAPDQLARPQDQIDIRSGTNHFESGNDVGRSALVKPQSSCHKRRDGESLRHDLTAPLHHGQRPKWARPGRIVFHGRPATSRAERHLLVREIDCAVSQEVTQRLGTSATRKISERWQHVLTDAVCTSVRPKPDVEPSSEAAVIAAMTQHGDDAQN